MRRLLFLLFLSFPLLFFFVLWPEIRLLALTKSLRQAVRYEMGYRFSFQKARLHSSGQIDYEGVQLEPISSNSFGTLNFKRIEVMPSISLTKRLVKAELKGLDGELSLSALPHRYTPPRLGRKGLFKSELSGVLKGRFAGEEFTFSRKRSGDVELKIGEILSLAPDQSLDLRHFPLGLVGKGIFKSLSLSGHLDPSGGLLTVENEGKAIGVLDLREGGGTLTAEGVGSATFYKEGERFFGDCHLSYSGFDLSGSFLGEEAEGGFLFAIKAPSATYQKEALKVAGELSLKLALNEEVVFAGELRRGIFQLEGAEPCSLSFAFNGTPASFDLKEVAIENGDLYLLSEGRGALSPSALTLFHFTLIEAPFSELGRLAGLKELALLPGKITELREDSFLSTEGVSLTGRASFPDFLGAKELSSEFHLSEKALSISELRGKFGELQVYGKEALHLERGSGSFDIAVGEEKVHLFGLASLSGGLHLSASPNSHLSSFHIEKGELLVSEAGEEGELVLKGDLKELSNDLYALKLASALPEMEGVLTLKLIKSYEEALFTIRSTPFKCGSLSAPSLLFLGSLKGEQFHVDALSLGDLTLSFSAELGDLLAVKELKLQSPYVEMLGSATLYPPFGLFEGEIENVTILPKQGLSLHGTCGAFRVELGKREPLSLELKGLKSDALELDLALHGSLEKIEGTAHSKEGSLALSLTKEKLTLNSFVFERATALSGLKSAELFKDGRFEMQFALNSPEFTPFGKGKVKGHLSEEAALFDELIDMQDGFYLSRVQLGEEPSYLSYEGDLTLHLLLDTAGKKTKVEMNRCLFEKR